MLTFKEAERILQEQFEKLEADLTGLRQPESRIGLGVFKPK